MKTKLAILIIVILLLASLSTARYYHGYKGVYGISWDLVGIDNQSGLYMCPYAGHIDDNGKYIRDFENPIAPYFPSLTADC